MKQEYVEIWEDGPWVYYRFHDLYPLDYAEGHLILPCPANTHPRTADGHRIMSLEWLDKAVKRLKQ
jgi:hypothetical protein